MSRASVLAQGRARAEASMVDACTIRRVTGLTTNATTGVVTPTYLSPNPYTGKCRVQQITGTARPHDVGQDFLLVQRIDVQLPVVGSEGLKVADEVTITASVHDQDLVGRVFLVHDLAHKSEATARRVGCSERTAS
jgi:hypothetical protein